MYRLNFEFLCQHLNIEIAPSGSRHYHAGWIHIECPFCSGNPGHHLGYNISQNFFTCWRCGFKPMKKVLQKLLSVSSENYFDTVRTFFENAPRKLEKKVVIPTAKTVKLPAGTVPLMRMHRNYLRERKFEPRKMREVWGLMGVGIAGEFCFRIIIPIYFKGRLVSYQGRDITGRAKLRYKNCITIQEVVHLKDIVYGFDNVPGKTVVICEGVTDVWRLGPGAVATFGVGFTAKQVKLLGESFNKRVIFFDQDDGGQQQSRKLAAKLAMYDGETTILTLKKFSVKDPGELPQKEADQIMEELLNDNNN